jgi:hypothetical protein
MRLEKVIPLPNHNLHVLLFDGREGIFDMRSYLDYEVFMPLRQLPNFMKIHNGGYFVEWECGADLSADTLEAGMVPAVEAQIAA